MKQHPSKSNLQQESGLSTTQQNDTIKQTKKIESNWRQTDKITTKQKNNRRPYDETTAALIGTIKTK